MVYQQGIDVFYLIVDLIWMRHSPLLRRYIKIITVSFSRKLCPMSPLKSNSISSSSTGNWAWSSKRSSQATSTFVSDEVLCVLNLDSGRLSNGSSFPRRDMARVWNRKVQKNTVRENGARASLSQKLLPPGRITKHWQIVSILLPAVCFHFSLAFLAPDEGMFCLIEIFGNPINILAVRSALLFWSRFKSHFLRISRIERHSQKIEFFFILPKHPFG